MKRFAVILFAGACAGSLVRAQSAPPTAEELQKQIQALQQQMQQMMQGYQTQIDQLKQQVDQLKAQQAGLQAQAATASEPPPPPPATPSAPPSPALSNPAISFIPDFTFSGGDDPYWKQGNPAQVREAEVAFSANIDPYASAFAALSWSQADGKFSVEEAYGLFPSLPGGWTMKLGRFYADFGKQNQMHTHAWFQADQPLAERVMIGPDGWGDTGVSLSHLLPTPWASDLTFQVGGDGPKRLFGGQSSQLSYLVAWRNFWDLSDNSNLEFQLSLAGGKNPTGHGTGVGNLALTYRYKTPGSKSHVLLWRTEFIADQYRTPDGILHSAGGFTYVDWQFTRNWFVGARADYAEHPLDPSLHDKGGALVLTWMPSEFQKFRLQYERTDYALMGMRDALVFEYGFAIGPHGAHPF
jgi:hypothetical protein